jgi:hypothetical protein
MGCQLCYEFEWSSSKLRDVVLELTIKFCWPDFGVLDIRIFSESYQYVGNKVTIYIGKS